MNFEIPQVDRDEELRLLNLLGFPDFDDPVECPNPYDSEIPLTARLIRCHGDDYHSRPELSHSQFVTFMDEPELYKAKIIDRRDEGKVDPVHFAFGKQVEHYLFHDEIPGDPVVIPQHKMSRRKRPAKWFLDHEVEYDPANDDHHSFAKVGKPYDEFVRSHHNRLVMTPKEYEEMIVPLDGIRDNVRDHSKAKALLYGDSLRHIAILFTCPFSGIELRCQLDNVSRQKSVNDYKTALRNDEWGFAADFYKWRYHIQASWYREAVRQLNGGDFWDVNYIVTEKQSRCWIVEVFHVADDWFSIALDEWQYHLKHFRSCLETGNWKRPSHNSVVDLRPPSYVKRQHKIWKATRHE